MNISVLGCGRWGSFLAWYHSAKNDVTLWGREGSRSLAALRETGGNRYLKLPERVCLTSDLGAALESAQLVVISISAQELRALAVVSNGVEKVQAGRLEKSGLGRFFDGVFVSGRVGATKPARKIFDTALNTLGIENRKKVLMIGDSLKADIAGGTGAGIDTCWCNFRGAVLPEGAPQPTYTIQGYEELLRIVMEEEELANAGSKEKRHQL